jgi:hypothetical protein
MAFVLRPIHRGLQGFDSAVAAASEVIRLPGICRRAEDHEEGVKICSDGRGSHDRKWLGGGNQFPTQSKFLQPTVLRQRF